MRSILIKVAKVLRIHQPLKDLKDELRARVRVARLPQKPFTEQRRSVFPGDVPGRASDVLCLFSSFDSESWVDDHVFYYLNAIRSQLGADIVFVTTSLDLREEDLIRLRPLCRLIVHRENIGHDFGSWKAGMLLLSDWASYSQLLLANDSVYGPFTSLKPVLGPLSSKEPTIVGITENFEFERHIQSYFLAFNRAAFTSRFFKLFWRNYRFFANRELLIEAYELGLSRRAFRAQCRVIPFIPYGPVKEKAIQQNPESFGARHASTRGVNPTHYFWKELIVDWKGPFLKVDLLRVNPISAPDVESAVRIVAENTVYPAEFIEKHQRRVRASMKKGSRPPV